MFGVKAFGVGDVEPAHVHGALGERDIHGAHGGVDAHGVGPAVLHGPLGDLVDLPKGEYDHPDDEDDQ